MGLLLIMNSRGDTRVAWDVADAGSLDRARRMVEEAYAQGKGVFRLDEAGVATRLKEFDPEAREIVVIPRLRGG
ncbi:MAG: hypothetical protein HY320_05670 [Armatimonadetes bacterium]|nr:hypothetical protein [Armatimonadota bacterium]